MRVSVIILSQPVNVRRSLSSHFIKDILSKMLASIAFDRKIFRVFFMILLRQKGGISSVSLLLTLSVTLCGDHQTDIIVMDSS